MAQADSKNSITASADTKSRRAFLIVAAVGSVAGAGSLAFAAAPNDVPKAVTVPPSPAIAGHDPVFGLIADKRAADIAHGEAIDAQDEADGRYGFHSDEASEADDRCLAACHAVRAIDWKLATTPPTTLAGVAAVLRFANEIEDAGMEWPHTDAIGREGWALPTTGDHGGGDRGDHSPDGGMRAMSDNVITFPEPAGLFPKRRTIPVTSESRENVRNGRNMHTFLFRSYDLIVQSDEADLVRDVCFDIDKAQTKLKGIRRRLQGVQEEAAAKVQLLTAADTKLTAAIVAALLSTRGGNSNA